MRQRHGIAGLPAYQEGGSPQEERDKSLGYSRIGFHGAPAHTPEDMGIARAASSGVAHLLKPEARHPFVYKTPEDDEQGRGFYPYIGLDTLKNEELARVQAEIERRYKGKVAPLGQESIMDWIESGQPEDRMELSRQLNPDGSFAAVETYGTEGGPYVPQWGMYLTRDEDRVREGEDLDPWGRDKDYAKIIIDIQKALEEKAVPPWPSIDPTWNPDNDPRQYRGTEISWNATPGDHVRFTHGHELAHHIYRGLNDPKWRGSYLETPGGMQLGTDVNASRFAAALMAIEDAPSDASKEDIIDRALENYWGRLLHGSNLASDQSDLMKQGWLGQVRKNWHMVGPDDMTGDVVQLGERERKSGWPDDPLVISPSFLKRAKRDQLGPRGAMASRTGGGQGRAMEMVIDNILEAPMYEDHPLNAPRTILDKLGSGIRAISGPLPLTIGRGVLRGLGSLMSRVLLEDPEPNYQ